MSNNTAEIEFAAVSNLAKSERRFRSVSYAIILFVAIFTIGLLYNGQQSQKTDTEHLLSEIKASNRKALIESRTVNLETTHYMTCLFVIPINDRTPAAQRKCFEQADLPGGLDEKNFITVPPDRSVESIPSVSDTNSNGSSSGLASSSANTTGQAQSSQPNNVQPADNNPQPEPQRILGIPVCVPFTQACVR
jgi:hypothetical protein